MQSNWNFQTSIVGKYSHFENIAWLFLIKLAICLPYDPAIMHSMPIWIQHLSSLKNVYICVSMKKKNEGSVERILEPIWQDEIGSVQVGMAIDWEPFWKSPNVQSWNNLSSKKKQCWIITQRIKYWCVQADINK